MSFLIGENMTCGYGGADILHGCTVGVEPGEIAVVVGPNGAGKSTAMKAMFGMLDLRKGRVMLDGTIFRRLPRRSGFFMAWALCRRPTMSSPA